MSVHGRNAHSTQSIHFFPFYLNFFILFHSSGNETYRFLEFEKSMALNLEGIFYHNHRNTPIILWEKLHKFDFSKKNPRNLFITKVIVIKWKDKPQIIYISHRLTKDRYTENIRKTLYINKKRSNQPNRNMGIVYKEVVTEEQILNV